MSINANINRTSAAGNGTTTAFGVSFPFVAASDLQVVLRAADGTETVQILGTNYTVSSPPYSAGGTVTFDTAPASGVTVVIYRDVPLTQPMNLQDGGPLPAGTANGAFDRLVMITQRLYERVARGINLRETDTPGSGQLDAGGNELTGLAAGTTGESAAIVRQIGDTTFSQFATFDPAPSGSVPRSVQSKLRDVVSVADFGAVGDGTTNSSTAFQKAATAGGVFSVPSGNYNFGAVITAGASDVFWDEGHVLNHDGTAPLGLPGVQEMWLSGHGKFLYDAQVKPNTVSTLRVDRNADYTGGTPSFLGSAVRINLAVAAGVEDFQFGISSILDNSATGGQNGAGFFQGNKLGTGPTWAINAEATDHSGNADPLTGLVAVELDIEGNGTDLHNNRWGLGVFLRRPPNDPALTSGAAAEAGYGISVDSSTDAGAIFYNAYHARGLFRTGLSFSDATIQGNAILLADSQKIAFRGDGSRALYYEPLTSSLRYAVEPAGTVLLEFFDSGDLNISGSYQVLETQVLTSRRTGWTAATGTATRATFATGSVTLPVLAQAVKALIDDLMSHGLIGS